VEGVVNHKPFPFVWLHSLPNDLKQAVYDLPEPLQQAVHEAVAACNPLYRPRAYTEDWLEELYAEAIVAAWEAHQRYEPDRGCSLYCWGSRVIKQRLQAFCNQVWRAAKHEQDYPCDEETGVEIDFPDESTLETIEQDMVCEAITEALMRLSASDRQLIEWHYGEEALTIREIAARLGVCKSVAHKRLLRALAHLRCEYENTNGVSTVNNRDAGEDKAEG
jgi:RNA polymerase sigma factor (sigma-70 family)